jgi:tetratricopeptide (TPR) repeat protein
VIGERAAGEVWSLRMLTREETAQRVRTMLGNPPDADALAGALHDLTGGNPLFLSEILTSLQADTTHTPASLASLIPQSLREGVLRRFEGLPKQTQDIGRALSLMDDALYPDAAQAMLSLGDGAFARGLDALISLGWLERRADGQLAWRNRVFREVVASTLEPHERARWHERLATALEQVGAPELARLHQWCKCPPTAERLQRMRDAYLRLRAQLPPRQRLEIVDGCLHAASQLGDGNARAALLCERPYLLFQLQDGLLHALDASQQALAALEAHPDADPDRELWVQVSCARAGQLAQLGRIREAQEALQPLRDDPSLRESQRLMVELSLAYISACQGDLRAAYTIHQRVWERLRANREWLMRWGGVLRYTLQYALAFGDRALAHAALQCVESWVLEPAFPERFQMLYHLMGADLAYYDGRGAEQQARARLALEMGEASGDPTAALEAWFQTLLYRQPAEAVRVAERALTLVRRALGQEREAEWLTRRALALLEAGQHAQAIDAADDARRAALKIGNQWHTAKAWLIIAQAHLATKRVAEAHEALQQATPIARALDAPELHCELYLTQAVAYLLAEDGRRSARAAISAGAGDCRCLGTRALSWLGARCGRAGEGRRRRPRPRRCAARRVRRAAADPTAPNAHNATAASSWLGSVSAAAGRDDPTLSLAIDAYAPVAQPARPRPVRLARSAGGRACGRFYAHGVALPPLGRRPRASESADDRLSGATLAAQSVRRIGGRLDSLRERRVPLVAAVRVATGCAGVRVRRERRAQHRAARPATGAAQRGDTPVRGRPAARVRRRSVVQRRPPAHARAAGGVPACAGAAAFRAQ